jgi:hypothetical protein
MQKLPEIPTAKENSIKIPTPTCTGTIFLENRERETPVFDKTSSSC